MTSSWTISLDLTNWYDSGEGGYSKSIPPSEFGHGIYCMQHTVCLLELQDRVSTRIIRSDCSSFRPTVSVTSKGRASVHVYNGYSGSINFGPFVHGPVYPTRKEGQAEILQKPVRGHENFQHPWSSRRHSNMKTFRHEDFQTWRHSSMKTSKCDDQHQRRLPFYPKILQQEDLQTNLHPFLP